MPRDRRSPVQPDATKEVMGATYRIEPDSPDRHSGDPQAQIALREPPAFEHPLDRLDLIIAGAPRVLPVSQAIPHGPLPSRSAEFAADVPEEVVCGLVDSAVGFYDRRFEGRRHRSGALFEDEARRPYDNGGSQADIPFERYLRS